MNIETNNPNKTNQLKLHISINNGCIIPGHVRQIFQNLSLKNFSSAKRPSMIKKKNPDY